MTAKSATNRALASALRSRGIVDVRHVWALAKQGVAAGISIEGVAEVIGENAHLHVPTRVSQPRAQYSARKPKASKAELAVAKARTLVEQAGAASGKTRKNLIRRADRALATASKQLAL